VRQANKLGQIYGPGRGHPALDFGYTQQRVIRADAKIAVLRQLEPTAQAVAVNGGNYGFPDIQAEGKRKQESSLLARPLPAIPCRALLQIPPDAEGPLPGPGHNGDPGLIIIVEILPGFE